MNIAVVGSGIAGLASACRLAANGHAVTVYEKNATVGGKISTIKKDGFTWDGGPSFFTDPDEFKQLFIDCGVDIDDYFSMKELDEACRYWYDKNQVRGYDSVDKLAAELENNFAEPVQHTFHYFSDMSKIYTGAGLLFLNNPVSWRSFFSIASIKTVLSMPKYPLFHSMHGVHNRYFMQNKTIQFFDRFATYVGANPYQAPGLLSCTPYLEHVVGAFHPTGGMRSIITAVAKLANNLGVVIKMNEEIVELELNGSQIDRIITNKSESAVDSVVFGGDIAQVYKLLDSKKYHAHSAKDHSLSAYVLYLGVKKRNMQDRLYLHNIFFSDNYKQESDSLWHKKTIYHDPTIYINNTSYYEKNDAPKGYENWFVMINVPAGLDKKHFQEARTVILNKLKKLFGDDFEKRIVTEAASLTPALLESRYNAFRGSIYGLAANSLKGAYMRPPNESKKVHNLYHVGVTAHPGGGIPLALRSAKIVANMIGKVR